MHIALQEDQDQTPSAESIVLPGRNSSFGGGVRECARVPRTPHYGVWVTAQRVGIYTLTQSSVVPSKPRLPFTLYT